jgi:hypothetical protein
MSFPSRSQPDAPWRHEPTPHFDRIFGELRAAGWTCTLPSARLVLPYAEHPEKAYRLRFYRTVRVQLVRPASLYHGDYSIGALAYCADAAELVARADRAAAKLVAKTDRVLAAAAARAAAEPRP